MEHQAQTHVLVNGEWVSRPIDPYQIIARAQQSDTEMQETITKPAIQATKVGILSRTLFASPLHTYAVPANILDDGVTNMVFIGEDSVYLKKVADNGQMSQVAAKTDVGGRILAAKVFGDTNNARISMGMGSQPATMHALYRKQQPWAANQGNVLPPEVIVLTLTPHTLMFLWADSLPTGAVNFSQKTIRLPAGTSQFSTFGKHLAIDPKHRAMAVAAQEGRFILYKTKTMELWRKEILQNKDTTPIEDERIISIKGHIIHMDFLSTGSGQDDFHVVLLFVVAHQGKTKITCFDWDCRHDLSKATVRTERCSCGYG